MELSKYEYDHFDMVTYYNFLDDGVELVTVFEGGEVKSREQIHEPIWDEPVDKKDVPDEVIEVFADES